MLLKRGIYADTERYFFRCRSFFRVIKLACAAIALAQGGSAQAVAPPAPVPATSAPSDPYNRTSPASTVFAFLEACRTRNYSAATRYLDLRKLTLEDRRKQGPRLAEDLGQALDTDPQFDLAALSRDPQGDPKDGLPPDRERVSSIHIGSKTVDIILERDELRSGVSVWRFSSDTVAQIPALTQTTAASSIERFLPHQLVRNGVLDTAWWRWIALTLAAIASAALARLLSRIVLGLLRPLFHGVRWLKASVQRGLDIIESFVGPLQLLLALALFRASVEAINPSALVRLFLSRALSLLSILAAVWLCMGFVDAAMMAVRAGLESKRRTLTHSVVPLGGRILKLTIVVFGVTAVLASWGYDTKTVLAGLGIGGIAIALAAKATVENFFGGLAVVTDHPVYVGDFCKFGDSVGTVEDIGLRSTRIRTLDRTLLTVPNAQFSSVTVENFSRQDKMLFRFTLNLRRDTTPDQLRSILSVIQKLLQRHPNIETGRLPVRFTGVGTYSLDIEVFAYILTQDGDEFMSIRQDLVLRILDAVAEAGTALALPTQASIPYGSEPVIANSQTGELVR